jgi:hypothetical protein
MRLIRASGLLDCRRTDGRAGDLWSHVRATDPLDRHLQITARQRLWLPRCAAPLRRQLRGRASMPLCWYSGMVVAGSDSLRVFPSYPSSSPKLGLLDRSSGANGVRRNCASTTRGMALMAVVRRLLAAGRINCPPLHRHSFRADERRSIQEMRSL